MKKCGKVIEFIKITTALTDLVRDVIPRARRAQLLQPLSQPGPHGQDPVCHVLDAAPPLLK